MRSRQFEGNESSVAGEDGMAGVLGYAATKAALIGMTLPAAREFAGRGIRASTPSWREASTRRSWTSLEARPRPGRPNFANPRRLGTAEEFAAFAAHIVENGFFNAATPRLDAGYRIPL